MSDGFKAEQSEYGLDLASIRAWRDDATINIGVAEHWCDEPANAKIRLTVSQAKELASWLMAAVGQSTRD